MKSPIQIEEPTIKKHYPSFNFLNYNQPYGAQITYDDYGINIKFLDDLRLPRVYGGGLMKKYILSDLDLYWPSEHMIGGQNYPLEAQLVHYSIEYENFQNALNYKDGLAIFSSFFTVSKTPNGAVDCILGTVPKNQTPQDMLETVTPRHFLAPKLEKFYRYNGSLTKPCYYENVIWTIFPTPGHISQSQLNQLKENWQIVNTSKTRNSREIKEIHDRRVYQSVL